jgi:hypothetical protein
VKVFVGQVFALTRILGAAIIIMAWSMKKPVPEKSSRPVGISKGKMMKSGFLFSRSTILTIILCVLVFLPCGCGFFNQLGETTAEGHRRHKRVLHLNRQEMMADIDRVFLLDEPSKLTDKRIP